jgi:hypothetical protein
MLEGAVQKMSQKMDVCFCLFILGPRLSPCQRGSRETAQVGETARSR